MRPCIDEFKKPDRWRPGHQTTSKRFPIDFPILTCFTCISKTNFKVVKMAKHYTPCGIGSVTHTSCSRPLPMPKRFGQYRYRWYGKSKKVVRPSKSSWKFVYIQFLESFWFSVRTDISGNIRAGGWRFHIKYFADFTWQFNRQCWQPKDFHRRLRTSQK